MDEWKAMSESVSKKLGRELQQEEIEFIKWVCEKRNEEQIGNRIKSGIIIIYDCM